MSVPSANVLLTDGFAITITKKLLFTAPVPFLIQLKQLL